MKQVAIENDKMNVEPAYYAVIPATVRYDKCIPANSKLLYGEITALCSKEGYCWASNNYFAGLYEVSPSNISRWIKALEESGYISVTYKYKQNTRSIEARILRLIGNKATVNDAQVVVDTERLPVAEVQEPIAEMHGGIAITQEAIAKTHGGIAETQKGIAKSAKRILHDNNTNSITKEESPVSPTEPPTSPVSPFFEQAENLANLLLNEHRKEIPDFLSGKDAATIARWKLDIEKLLRIDKKSPADVEAVIRWIKKPGNFWFPNIISGEKLRKQYECLIGQMKTEGYKQQGRVKKPAYKNSGEKTGEELLSLCTFNSKTYNSNSQPEKTGTDLLSLCRS